MRGVAAAGSSGAQNRADREQRGAFGRPAGCALSSREPGEPEQHQPAGDVEIEPQAQEVLGAVDPQRLFEDPECRLPGHVQSDSPGGWPADVDDDPAVGERDDRRLAIERHLAVEHVGVEAPRPADVGADDEVRDQDSLPGRRELGYR
jgi:hypothetical protein